MPGGRPTKYSTKHVDTLHRMSEAFTLGFTNEGLAAFFGVSVATIKAWKNKHPEFLAAIQKIKDNPDDNVERALYQRAIGYSHPEDRIFNNNGKILVAPTIKHYPPDTAAAFIWLKNRRKEQWRDRHEVTGADGGPLEVTYRVVGNDDAN